MINRVNDTEQPRRISATHKCIMMTNIEFNSRRSLVFKNHSWIALRMTTNNPTEAHVICTEGTGFMMSQWNLLSLVVLFIVLPTESTIQICYTVIFRFTQIDFFGAFKTWFFTEIMINTLNVIRSRADLLEALSNRQSRYKEDQDKISSSLLLVLVYRSFQDF